MTYTSTDLSFAIRRFFGLLNNILMFLMSLILVVLSLHDTDDANKKVTRMWADAQRDGRPAEYRWRHLFNATTFD